MLNVDLCDWVAERGAGCPFFSSRGWFMAWLIERAKEPSTWRGVGWLLVAAGVLPVGSVDILVSAGVVLVGAVEILRAEK